jgi:DNA-directed RNA polymerase III subunit RPC1|tara:strand:- start:297 stop:614 length:318 start_codon:yes stop_codon:yes gene_type:complete
VDSESVRLSILRGSRGVTRPAVLRLLKDTDVKIKRGCNNKLRVYIPSDNKGSTYFCMQQLKTILPKVIVQGIPTINRAVINETDKDGKSSYNLFVEGYGLQDVMV